MLMRVKYYIPRDAKYEVSNTYQGGESDENPFCESIVVLNKILLHVSMA